MWPVVKDFCDNACWLVVLVRCRATGRVSAYCRDCGAAWLSPAEFRRNDFVVGSELCPQGIDVPSPEELARSPWAGLVREFVPEAEYSTAAEFNERLARERAAAPIGPVRRRFVLDWQARPPRGWVGIVELLASWLPARQGHPWYQGSGSLVDRLRQAREQAQRDA